MSRNTKIDGKQWTISFSYPISILRRTVELLFISVRRSQNRDRPVDLRSRANLLYSRVFGLCLTIWSKTVTESSMAIHLKIIQSKLASYLTLFKSRYQMRRDSEATPQNRLKPWNIFHQNDKPNFQSSKQEKRSSNNFGWDACDHWGLQHLPILSRLGLGRSIWTSEILGNDSQLGFILP